MRKMILLVLMASGIAIAANFTIVIDGSSLSRPRGEFYPLADGGFLLSWCHTVKQTDGGSIGSVFRDCVTCEPGGWNGAPATCQAAWKAANGGL